MKFCFALIVLIVICLPMKAQDTIMVDHEQNDLALCYKYSNELGYNIESIKNPALYQVIHEWIGTPYKYSGQGKNGIDCSGFVCEMYRSVYNNVLSGSAVDIYKRVVPVDKSELSEGDLVFFKIRRGRISHIGIYLGTNKFVHASSHNGVIISDLNETYYQKYYFKGGRITQ